MTGPKTNEREGTRAVLRNTRTSAYKLREVLDLIRGLPVGEARDVLRFSERDAAALVLKLLNSAVANAENNDGLDGDELYVAACFADEGRTYKTFRPRARGRAGRIRKRTAHVTIIVSRLPEDRLGIVRAKRERAEADRRARRVAASQKQAGRPRRARRRGGDAGTTAEEEGIVDQQAAALEQVDDDGEDTGTDASQAAAVAEAESDDAAAAEEAAADQAGVADTATDEAADTTQAEQSEPADRAEDEER